MFIIDGKKPVIFSDFDGTITERDVIIMIMETFAPPEWRRIVEQIMKTRTLSIRDGVRQLFHLIPGEKKSEIIRYVMENVRLRAGFIDFLNFCQAVDIPFIVVSGGVDFFIQPILAPYREKLQIFCNSADFYPDRIELTMPFYNADCEPCGQCACCKLSILDRYPAREYFKIAVGDSLSDLAIAKTADWTFARHPLTGYLAADQMPFTPFETFLDIQNALVKRVAPVHAK